MPKCVIILASLSIGMLTAAQERPRMIRVSGAVMVGLVEKSALPVYPQLAREKGITGEVIFKILVDETGRIVMTEPVDGDPLLVAASIDALREFRYRPYQLMGSAIKVESQVGFRFANNGKVEQLSSIPNRPEFKTGVLKANGSFVLWPRKISGEEPALPPELSGKSGAVYLTIAIAADGSVQDIRVLGGNQALIEPVVSAVKRFKYEPQLVDGIPSPATLEASYHFGSSR